MQRRSRLVAVLCSAVLTGACSSSESLAETAWTMDSLAGFEIPAGVVAGLEFVDAALVSVLTGCNDYTGPYETDGDTISIGPLAGTLKACTEPLMAFETAYTTALQAAATYSIEGDALLLNGPNGASLISFDRFEAQLAGTAWDVISYNNGNEAVVTVAAGTEITLAFDDAGNVAGSGGCNEYSGPYETTDDEISIGPLTSTLRACEADVMEQESLYLAALEAATTWTIRGTVLELRDDGGALQVSANLAS